MTTLGAQSGHRSPFEIAGEVLYCAIQQVRIAQYMYKLSLRGIVLDHSRAD